MTIIEALKKSQYLHHPRINGLIIANTGEWEDGWSRLYMNQAGNQYTTSSMDLGPDLVTCDLWTPVKFTVTIEAFDTPDNQGV